MKIKIDECVFLAGFKLQLSSFQQVEKNCFYHKAPIPSFKKVCFLSVSQLYRDTHRIHCTIPWQRMSGESVLWVLTSIQVVNLIRGNGIVRWIPSNKWQEACHFQKTQILDHISYWNEEKNELVYFWVWGGEICGYSYSAFIGRKYCISNFQVHNNIFPSIFAVL